MFFLVLAFCLVNPVISRQEKKEITIGVITEDHDKLVPSVFEMAFDLINQKRDMRNDPKMNHIIESASTYDSFTAFEKVCKMLERNARGMLAAVSLETSYQINSFCSERTLPLVKSVVDYHSKENQEELSPINVMPSPRSIGRAIADFILDRKWLREFSIVYENETSLFMLQDVLSIESTIIQTHQLNPSGDYRPLLKFLVSNASSTILLDCSIEKTVEFLRQADEIKMLTMSQDYIITNLDLYAVDLRHLKDRNVNITAFQLVQPETDHFKVFVRHMHEQYPHLKELLPFGIRTEYALHYDAVLVYMKALSNIVLEEKYAPLTEAYFTCDTTFYTMKAENLRDAFYELTENGITGKLKFTHTGARTDFNITVLKYQDDALKPISMWNSHLGLHNLLSEHQLQQLSESSLINKTIIVTAIKMKPFLYIKDDPTLTGNDRFEGYIPDLMKELGRLGKFYYEIHKVKDDKYGDNKTGKWNII